MTFRPAGTFFALLRLDLARSHRANVDRFEDFCHVLVDRAYGNTHVISLTQTAPKHRQHDVRRARRRPQQKRPAATFDAERAVAEPAHARDGPVVAMTHHYALADDDGRRSLVHQRPRQAQDRTPVPPEPLDRLPDGFLRRRDAAGARAPGRLVRDSYGGGRSCRGQVALPRRDARVGAPEAAPPRRWWRLYGFRRRRRRRRGRLGGGEAHGGAGLLRDAFRAARGRAQPRRAVLVGREGRVARRRVELTQEMRVETASARAALLRIRRGPVRR